MTANMSRLSELYDIFNYIAYKLDLYVNTYFLGQ